MLLSMGVELDLPASFDVVEHSLDRTLDRDERVKMTILSRDGVKARN